MSAEEEANPSPPTTQEKEEKEEENETKNESNDSGKENGTTPLSNLIEQLENTIKESAKENDNEEVNKEEESDKISNEDSNANKEKKSEKESDNDESNEEKSLENNNSPQEIFDTTQPPDVVQPTTENQVEKISTSSSSNVDEENQHENDQEKELDDAIDELVNRFVAPAPELRAPIMQLLERRRVEALIAGDYDLAEHYDKVGGILQTVLQNEQQKINEDKTIDILYSRWQQLIQKQNQINSKWDLKVQEFTENSDRQKEEMKMAHEEEIDNFISKWKDPNFLRPFNKPSAKLLQLREQEKAMAISRMYSQAKEMKAIADRLQREETQQAQAKISATMTMERNKLSAKQNKEVNAWNSYRQRMLKNFQAERQKELRPVQTAMQQIKAKKSSPLKGSGQRRQRYGMSNSTLPVLPNSRAESCMSEASSRPPQSAKKGAANANNPNSTNYSPRTIYKKFRSEKKTTLLDVTPVDDATLLSMKKPTTARSRSTVGTATSRGPTVKRTQVPKKVPNRK